MNAVDIIVKKRDGSELSAAEIEYFIQCYTGGRIPDYQAAAWAMAVYFRGMSDAETTALYNRLAQALDTRGPTDAPFEMPEAVPWFRRKVCVVHRGLFGSVSVRGVREVGLLNPPHICN